MRHITYILLVLTCMAVPLLAANKPKGNIVTVTIRGGGFTPGTVSVKVGDTVEWVNSDERDHTVVATDKSFNSGNISPGGSFTVRFSKAGKFSYACSLHPRERGVVNVQ